MIYGSKKRPVTLRAEYIEASLQSTAVMGSPPLYSSRNPPSKICIRFWHHCQNRED